MNRFASLLFALALSLPVFGQAVEIGIEGVGDPRSRIAVPPIVVEMGMEDKGKEFTEVLSYDLQFTNEFVVIPSSQYPPGFRALPPDAAQLNLTEWQGTTAESIAYVRLRNEGGRYIAECRLFDIASGQQALGKEVAADSVRIAAHEFADQITLYTTGVIGCATSRVAFGGNTTGANKEIFIADYDGANVVQVTKHNNTSIKPKISPDGRRIAYVSFKDTGQFLYVIDIATGESRAISRKAGMNAAPNWAPDGASLVFVLSKDGNPEIYTCAPDGSNLRRLTDNKSVDTSPAFHPSGQTIAFVSERMGRPQIFSMDASGGNVQRLSYQGGAAYDPVYSPDGKWLAYVAERSGEGLQIYILDAANPQNYRRISSAGGESPTWSPDSRHIGFSTSRRGKSEVWSATVPLAQNIPVVETPMPRITMRTEGPSWGPRRNAAP